MINENESVWIFASCRVLRFVNALISQVYEFYILSLMLSDLAVYIELENKLKKEVKQI